MRDFINYMLLSVQVHIRNLKNLNFLLKHFFTSFDFDFCIKKTPATFEATSVCSVEKFYFLIYNIFGETFYKFVRLISERDKYTPFGKEFKSMDNGASSYRRFLDGDDKALAEIVRDYKDGLILYLNGIVNNISVAEELMEETLFKIITKKPRFNAKYSFKTWLYTIGRNVAIDYLRHNKNLSNSSLDDLENYIQDEHDLEKLYIIEEQKIVVHRALKKLNAEYRQVLWLIYFEELSNAETAVIMKKTSRQMKNLVYRAKSALKTELEKEDFIYEEL